MSRLRALAWIFAVSLSSPLAAKSEGVRSPVTADVSGAAAIAASYGAITSTYRSVAHNRAVGGVANSYHLTGRAIDVARKRGVTHGQIAAALQRAGYVMIESLDEGDHSHFAFAGTRTISNATTITLAAAKPAKPAKPSPPPLLADDHGTLLIDMPAGGALEAKTSLPKAAAPGTVARD